MSHSFPQSIVYITEFLRFKYPIQVEVEKSEHQKQVFLVLTLLTDEWLTLPAIFYVLSIKREQVQVVVNIQEFYDFFKPEIPRGHANS